MTGKLLIYFAISGVAIVAGWWVWKMTARNAYENAEYTVLKSDGDYEIREYPKLMLATTDMRFTSPGDDGSFMRLFGYISGANDQNQKVAMTVPVFMEPEHGDSSGQMGFVLPKDIAERSAPEPSASGVWLQTRQGGQFAVIKFAGRLNKETAARAEQHLRQWMEGNGLEAAGEPEYASYDPPWTPGPLRRNEVLIRLQVGK